MWKREGIITKRKVKEGHREHFISTEIRGENIDIQCSPVGGGLQLKARLGVLRVQIWGQDCESQACCSASTTTGARL